MMLPSTVTRCAFFSSNRFFTSHRPTAGNPPLNGGVAPVSTNDGEPVSKYWFSAFDLVERYTRYSVAPGAPVHVREIAGFLSFFTLTVTSFETDENTHVSSATFL